MISQLLGHDSATPSLGPAAASLPRRQTGWPERPQGGRCGLLYSSGIPRFHCTRSSEFAGPPEQTAADGGTCFRGVLGPGLTPEGLKRSRGPGLRRADTGGRGRSEATGAGVRAAGPRGPGRGAAAGNLPITAAEPQACPPALKERMLLARGLGGNGACAHLADSHTNPRTARLFLL